MNTNYQLEFTPESILSLCRCMSNGNSIGYALVVDLESGKPRIEETNSSDNAITFHRYHGHEAVLADVSDADASEIVDWYNSNIAPRMEVVVEGYTSEWDGSNNIARLTEDAQSVLEDVLEWARDNVPSLPEGYGAYEAADYLCGGEYPVTADSTDEELRELAQSLVAEALAEGALIDEDGVVGYLEYLREKTRD